MMLRLTAVVAQFPDLAEAELRAWIERGWVRAEWQDPDWVLQEIDVARVRLVYDVRHMMGVTEDATPLVLSLLDQIYGLRAQMRAVARAVERQPATVRDAILAAMRE
jgi:chaperone modulatory protein CbpM